MTLVQRQGDGWSRVTARTVVAPDGGQITRAALLRALERGDTDTAERFQTAIAPTEPVPDGQRRVRGTERIEDRDGKPVRVADYEPIPEPEPDLRTDAEKFEAANDGLTVDQIKAVLGIATESTRT